MACEVYPELFAPLPNVRADGGGKAPVEEIRREEEIRDALCPVLLHVADLLLLLVSIPVLVLSGIHLRREDGSSAPPPAGAAAVRPASLPLRNKGDGTTSASISRTSASSFCNLVSLSERQWAGASSSGCSVSRAAEPPSSRARLPIDLEKFVPTLVTFGLVD